MFHGPLLLLVVTPPREEAIRATAGHYVQLGVIERTLRAADGRH